MNLDRVLVISQLHRASPFFDTSLRRLQAAGLTHILLQDTGRGLGTSQVPGVQFVPPIGYALAYDQGMIRMKKLLTDLRDYDAILLIDSDAFYAGTRLLAEYIQEFEAGGYDLACHLVDKSWTTEYVFGDQQIAHVPEVTFAACETNSDVNPPAPTPHFENSAMLFSTKLWQGLTEVEIGHTRRLLAGAVRCGAKFGARQVSYLGKFAHYNPEWFHVGNLVAHTYAIERGESTFFRVNSPVEMPRLGYFAAEQLHYGRNIYGPLFNQHLEQALAHVGGRDVALAAWDEFVRGTIMETWTV